MIINDNTSIEFSKLRGTDLQNLLIEIENTLLEYRDSLYLPNELTFGVEIEYEKLEDKYVENFLHKKLKDWKLRDDGTVSSGGEIVSPILTDKNRSWKDLKAVCEFLTKKEADPFHNAGAHIHIGTCILGDDIEAWRQFLKVYAAYENIILRFSFGERINERANFLKYSRPYADIIHSHLGDINESNKVSRLHTLSVYERYYALNLNNTSFEKPNDNTYKNTIEFRSPNGTTSEIIWQNNINVFAKMLVSAKDKAMDEDFLNYKLEKEYTPFSENARIYNAINLKDALQFADLIFDNNLDKIYFLRQYLKDFKECQKELEPVMAKSFIKK